MSSDTSTQIVKWLAIVFLGFLLCLVAYQYCHKIWQGQTALTFLFIVALVCWIASVSCHIGRFACSNCNAIRPLPPFNSGPPQHTPSPPQSSYPGANISRKTPAKNDRSPPANSTSNRATVPPRSSPPALARSTIGIPKAPSPAALQGRSHPFSPGFTSLPSQDLSPSSPPQQVHSDLSFMAPIHRLQEVQNLMRQVHSLESKPPSQNNRAKIQELQQRVMELSNVVTHQEVSNVSGGSPVNHSANGQEPPPHALDGRDN